MNIQLVFETHAISEDNEHAIAAVSAMLGWRPWLP